MVFYVATTPIGSGPPYYWALLSHSDTPQW